MEKLGGFFLHQNSFRNILDGDFSASEKHLWIGIRCLYNV
jgi:hypothetical protein